MLEWESRNGLLTRQLRSSCLSIVRLFYAVFMYTILTQPNRLLFHAVRGFTGH